MTYAEQLTAPITEHGEGPVWWPDGHLRCVDLLAGDLVDVHEDATITRTHISEVAAVWPTTKHPDAAARLVRGESLDDQVEEQTFPHRKSRM